MNVAFIIFVGRAWKIRNAKNFCIIVINVTDFVITLIQHITKESDTWNIFCFQYETKNQTKI